MLINTTVFCLEPGNKLVKTDSRLTVQIIDEIIPKLHNKMNRHIKDAAVTRQNAYITTEVDRNTGYIRCDGNVHYIIHIDKLLKRGNVYYYGEYMIMVDTDAGIARVYGQPFENSPSLYEYKWSPKKNEEFDRKCLKKCTGFVEKLYIEYIIRTLNERDKEMEEMANET